MDEAASAASQPVKDGLSISRRGAMALVTLDRPAARNALTIAMRQRLIEAYPGFARDAEVYALVVRSHVPGAFCVGGDVREMAALTRTDLAAARAGLAQELRLTWQVECFSKPTVSLIDGAVMGTGVGISLYGTHRVAGPGYRFAMPEVRIGYFPDCGVLHALARMPHAIGRYLALTGRSIDRADAYHLGLVTHCLTREAFAEVEAGLADADPVDPLLDARHRDPGAGPLLAHNARIARCFAAPDVAGVVAALENCDSTDREWAAGVLADLRDASPIALAVTDRALRQAAQLDLKATLEQDYRLAFRFADLDDFREGVRAVLVDKDASPRWQPATLADVTPARLDELFAPLAEGELDLASRTRMQATRA